MKIAIIGMACRYPDARSPQELWENALAQRRAFRRLPPERLSLSDYYAADRNVPDRIYAQQAAVIEGYNFDRVGFRVAGSTYRSADLAHWLALDMAARAVADAGFHEASELPQASTGVLLGNTLTGEFSRANTLRLRWPYVRRVVAEQLKEAGVPETDRNQLLVKLETNYKKPFAPIGEESLAGNLSNTIAGRICNHFDLKGGGYTIDGACSSSLLAVAHACSALVAGDLDLALAGGVDLSLDPFELVGFAKTGALTAQEMRVYDQHSSGFIPGEGCAMVVLMRYEDAIAQQRPIYATICGWGISSDGKGGITRPEVAGQLLALQRAYGKAGFTPDTVAYFEGHGTGTSVGDATELQTLSQARREAIATASTTQPMSMPATIGSIKANIGHTKAAAGIAGLIKATLALRSQILPPTTGCDKTHPELTREQAQLQILRQGRPWPKQMPLRAGVSAMGFGGINAHLVVENPRGDRRQSLTLQEQQLLNTFQDAELFLLAAANPEQLQQQVEQLLTLAPRISSAELTDLAAELARTLDVSLPIRAAIVADHPQTLTTTLQTLREAIHYSLQHSCPSSEQTSISAAMINRRFSRNVYWGTVARSPRIGFLFPGQASPVYLDGGAWARRFPGIAQAYRAANLPSEGNRQSTAIAQPAIVTASSLGAKVLALLGIHADVAVGHSLGELNALQWAGAFDEATLWQLTQVRGQAMANLGDPTGMMASVHADEVTIRTLLGERLRDACDPQNISGTVVIAGLNGPEQTVLSGDRTVLQTCLDLLKIQKIKTSVLPVSHAFHSPLVAAATRPLEPYLASIPMQPLRKAVISTVTGSRLTLDEDLKARLIEQVTAPVQFMAAATQAAASVDLLLEVGPGQVLTGLAQRFIDVPAIAIDASGPSLQGLLQAAGAAFVLGVPLDRQALFGDRFTRPFNLDWQPRFFANPCEQAPMEQVSVETETTITQSASIQSLESDELMPVDETPGSPAPGQMTTDLTPLDCIRQRVAERAELPIEVIAEHHRLLSDLHLNSITVSQLVSEASRHFGLAPSVAPTEFADASVAEVARALEELVQQGGLSETESRHSLPPGVESWIRSFTMEWVEQPLTSQRNTTNGRRRHGVFHESDSQWHIIASQRPEDTHQSADNSFIKALQDAFLHQIGQGVIVYLSAEPLAAQIDRLLAGAQQVLSLLSDRPTEGKSSIPTFVLVHNGGIGAAFARTLALEAPQLKVCVIDLPVTHPQAVAWIIAEVQAADGYREARYDTYGIRRSPQLRLLPQSSDQAEPIPLDETDVLLVSGGGKGIAAECALALAQSTGVKLALVGRSDPEQDETLAENLTRLQGAGITVQYHCADVTDVAAVHQAVQTFEQTLGPITGLIHGAGVNTPKLIRQLTLADMLTTCGPKVDGLQHLLAAIAPEKLRLLVTFGSIIARIGLPGEADYALANEAIAQQVAQFRATHPHCRCLNLEWSVWSGVGMGQRLGRVDSLMQQGITPIPVETGISILTRLLQRPLPTTSVIVAGRFGQPPTLAMAQPSLPLLRFLEQPQVHYPGIELIVDAQLSPGSDPYLEDHVYQGDRLFPGVMGLEAMAQTVMALLGSEQPPNFQQVQFHRPVVVSAEAPLTIRIAALLQPSGQVKVVLRSEQTGFKVDHFEAIAVPTDAQSHPASCKLRPLVVNHPVALDPQRDLYGELLFHQGRFQRLRRYCQLQAKACLAEISTTASQPWFGAYYPQTLVLGDPGARDAVIHALQACVPQATLLPTGIEQVIRYQANSGPNQFVVAQERQHIDDRFTYDLDVIAADGTVLEQWSGLELKVIRHRDHQQALAAPLLANVLERRLQERFPETNLRLAIERDGTVDREIRRDRLVSHLVPATAATQLTHRPDGKPELSNGQGVSVAHCQDLTMVVTGAGAIACDLEVVSTKDLTLWRDLLGAERLALAELVVHETGESLDLAATRVWCVGECLKKAGASVNAPVQLKQLSDQEVWFEAQGGAIATFVLSAQEVEQPLVFAVLMKQSIISQGEKSLEEGRSQYVQGV